MKKNKQDAGRQKAKQPSLRVKGMQELSAQRNPWQSHVFGKRNATLRGRNTAAGRGSSRRWVKTEVWNEAG